MATIHRNLSRLDPQLPSAADMKFGIVVSQWNPQITGALLEGAVRTLRAAGCEEQNIIVKEVPGTFELALGAQYFAEYTDVDGVIVLGCVIQGETRHFDYVCQGVTQGVTQLMLSRICSRRSTGPGASTATRATRPLWRRSAWSPCRSKWHLTRAKTTARKSIEVP